MLALVLVARGNAGSNGADFSTTALPSQLTSGQTGFAVAKFKPNGAGNKGSATHVTITLTFPAGVTAVAVTACPGSSSVSGQVATCVIGTVQNGQQVKMFATYVAGASNADAEVDGHVSWDVPTGGGSTGGNNIADASSTVAIYGATATFAGKCSSNDSVGASDPVTGKGTTVVFGSVDSALGFPCTPAQAGVDPGTTVGNHTPGVWTLTVAPLQGGAAANATLTLATLPSGTNWKKAQLFELDADNNATLVPACASATAPPTTGDACLAGQAKFGRGGVEFFVNVLGTLIDPRFTS